jgi:hypothetical protein
MDDLDAQIPSGGYSKEPTDFDPIETLMRLLIGMALIGVDEFILRLRRWHELADAQAVAQDSSPGAMTGGELARLALLGACFNGEARIRRRLLRLWRTWGRFAGRVPPSLALLIPRTPIVACDTLADELALKALRLVAGWAALGRAEEVRGRALARQTIADVVEEAIEELARQPALRELILQQGEGFASEAVGEVRERAVAADLWVERVVRGLLRRPSNGHGGEPPARAVPLIPAVEEQADEASVSPR